MQFGYRKTSMDDIAQRAGMSRSALYLHFKNKEDICRSLVAFFYDRKCDAIAEALAQDAPVQQILIDAFATHLSSLVDLVVKGPSGAELVDAGAQVAADIVAAGELRLQDLYTGWLDRERSAGRVRRDLSADDMARTCMALLKGVHARASDLTDLRAEVTPLAQVIGRGLSP